MHDKTMHNTPMHDKPMHEKPMHDKPMHEKETKDSKETRINDLLIELQIHFFELERSSNEIEMLSELQRHENVLADCNKERDDVEKSIFERILKLMSDVEVGDEVENNESNESIEERIVEEMIELKH